MVKEHIRKPKCKGIWRVEVSNGVVFYRCTKCKKKLIAAHGRIAIHHKDL